MILYDDCDDDIKRYILFLELLEHMLSSFSTAMTIAPQQSVGQVGSWKQAPWSRRQRGNGACKEMLLAEFQVSPGLWVFLQRWSLRPSNGFCWVQERCYIFFSDYGPTLEIEIPFSLSSKRIQVDIVFFQSWMQKIKIFSQV